MRFSLLVLIAFAAPALGAQPVPVRITVAPTEVELSGARDRQGIVVQAQFADGSTRDVTAQAQFTFEKPFAKATNGFLAPLADGSTTLTIAHAGHSAVVPVTVKQSASIEPIRFRTDVMPVFTKVGCNTGKCHGSASGKDGFRLSLFGYDPDGDLFRLTRELGGRRINLSTPEDCLLVNKSTGKVPHTGGKRIEPGSENHMLLLRWLEAGAPRDPKDTPKPIAIEVFPKTVVFAAKGDTQRVVVRAKYSDGTDRDVTRFCVFVGNNDSAAVAGEAGFITGTGPGEAFVLARFDEFTEGTAVIVRPGTPFTDPKTPEFNYIDGHVHAKLNRLHVVPSDVCTDEVYVRRVYIDLVGQLSTPAEREAFLASADPKKREKLVDSLIEREEFRDIWVMKWAELLQIRTVNGITPKGLQLYDKWLRNRIHSGVTIDRVVRELLPANGGTFENPPVNFYQTETTPQLLAENAAQVFLGTRIQCAQCHNHPFDRWTMDDYYGFAAFFSQIGYKNAQDPRELTVFNAAAGEMLHPVGNRVVKPKFLGATAPEIKPGQDYRAVLADWLASTENAAFARNIGNIVWAHFFGKGIVDPVDDVRVSNPASNRELLDALGQKVSAYKFDVKKLARDICLSRTYQLSTKRNPTNEWDERNFARQTVRRMRAEVLLDCISQVTGTSDRLPGLPLGGKAVQVPDGRAMNYFLTTFGRASRNTACSCEVKTTPTLSQALHLLNGETTSGKITEGKLIDKLLTERDAAAVASELYVRCLGRKPTAAEAELIATRLEKSADKKAALEDLFWALLNTNEFIFNR
ncbi:MAG: cell surface protein [Planctomycetaceae bacterium]|nr:cell surface protein [Planctomycetaceae bacterium]